MHHVSIPKTGDRGRYKNSKPRSGNFFGNRVRSHDSTAGGPQTVGGLMSRTTITLAPPEEVQMINSANQRPNTQG